MGFLPISIGVMLLFDYPIGLTHPGSEEVYAALDIFPNVLGFALILFGLIRMGRRGFACRRETVCAGFMTALSALVLIKDVFLYARFFENRAENTASRCISFCQHLLILAFLVLLFRKTGAVLTEKGEEKLARSHGRMTVFALMEGIVYTVCFILGFVSGEGVVQTVVYVTGLLDMLLWLFIVWYGGVNQMRAALRTN